jgi:hypothetical protein
MCVPSSFVAVAAVAGTMVVGCAKTSSPISASSAAADLDGAFYPANHALWPSAPLCNPCDHPGTGNDPRNNHDAAPEARKVT